MKLITRFFSFAVAGVLLLSSCAKDESESFDPVEDIALKAWMTKYRPELLENLQADGYYVEIEKVGDANEKPINDTACWVRFDFSGRDLSGNIVLTRRANEAKLIGSYTKYTHYVPYFRYCGETNSMLMEGTYLAMRNTLTLGEKYATEKGLPTQLLLRKGSVVKLYMPSRVVSSSGVEGDGGYEGQYSLNSQRPFIVTMTITDVVKNPLEAEGGDVDAFCGDNGKLRIYSTDKDENPDAEPLPEDSEAKNHPYNVDERWVSACDSIPQLYVNYRFTPEEKFAYPTIYQAAYEPYNNFAKLETDIAAALKKRFHEEDDYVGIKALKADSVKLEGTAKIWYIGRFLDGFIFDTNIDEVKKLIYGEVTTTGSALSYTPEEGGLISAFYYVIPHMQFGQWGALITTSTNAYGSTGQSGTTSSSSSSSGYSSSYYDYLNYMSYANSYYGSSGYYGGYYNNYYGNYYNGYYNSYGSSDSSTTTTTTTVKTEISPYTPLIFEFYIEPADE